MIRSIGALLVVVVSTGCTPTLTRTRALVSRGDLAGAAVSAGDDRLALQEVSLAILVRGLDDEPTRVEAMRGLAVAGPVAARSLSHVVETARPEVAVLAAAVLHGEGWRSERIETVLREGLTAGDAEVRAAATRALGPSHQEPGFIRARLADEAAVVRLAAIDALAARSTADPDVIALLIEVVGSDCVPAVRARALRALSRSGLGEVRLTELAAEVSASPELTLRLAAVDALAPYAVRPGPRTALRRTMSDSMGVEAVAAALVLASTGDADALRSLRAALSGSSALRASTAAIGAASLAEPLAPALVAALGREEPEVRLDAAVSLLGTGERGRSLAVLRNLLDESGWVGVHAALVLAREDDEVAFAHLAEALESGEPRLRAYISATAGVVPASLPLLTRSLADTDGSVRIAAASAVLRILRRAG